MQQMLGTTIVAVKKNGKCAVVGSRDKIDEAGDIFTIKEDI